jgi:hypothetical protein
VVAQLQSVALAEDRKAREGRRRALKAHLGNSGAGFARACKLLVEQRQPPVATLRSADGVYVTRPLELDDIIAEAWGQVFNPKEMISPEERTRRYFEHASNEILVADPF